ncbi:MAG TPA: hypothetical protein VN766_10845 [Stellaceae bacterium]|jgi:hypothetical protein|nr:hypothetical protein [Stellaceae bacterium]
MRRSLCLAVLGLAVAGMPAAQAGPHMLTAAEMDRVTAGLELGLASGALAGGGSVAVAEVNGGGGGSQIALPGGGTAESGAIGGTASAVGSGINNTGVATAGTVNGATLVNRTFAGTIGAPGGQASLGFTYVSGGTFFLP